jgi:RimJ/RimL family protein N-acetyltransferase
MPDVATYSEVELLPNGRQVEIRALRPNDRVDLLAAVDQSSARSLYRRFFSPKRRFTEKEIAYFVNIDFVNHVALVVASEEDGQSIIIGGGRYIVVEPGRAEVAFAVVDKYQKQGVGAALMRHLAAIAHEAGLKELFAEVMAENVSMLKVFEKSGLHPITTREAGLVHVTLPLP